MIQFFDRHKYPLLLGLFVFAVIYVFFAQIHPVYPYDADDWTYLHNWRDMYPSTAKYNPTRVLPEILMPFCGELSMMLVYPFVGDITISVCILSSIVLALSISMYMLLFYRMLRKVVKLEQSGSFILTLLFLIFHFFLFLNSDWDNQHLFHSFDLCCHYNYTIPNIWASCLVLLFITDKFEDFSLNSKPVIKGFFIVSLYLIVLSHVFESIILIAYLGVLLLWQSIIAIKKKESFLRLGRKYIIHISVIVFWLVILIFEANGPRARAVQNIAQNTFSSALIESIRNFMNMFVYGTNRIADFFLIASLIAFGILTYRDKNYRKFNKNVILTIGAFAICSIYLALMAAKSYPYYLLRLMTLYAAPFFFLLSCFFALAVVLKKHRKIVVLFPFLLLFFFSKIERYGETFQDIQTLNIKQEVQGTYRISPQDILRQNRRNIQFLIQADKMKEEHPVILVPKFDHVDNWPIADYYGLRLGRYLYKYGFISTPIKAAIEPQEPVSQ